MGIERSYRAFFGFEISSTGNFWNSRACVSFKKEQHRDDGTYASAGKGTFRSQVDAYTRQVQNPEKPKETQYSSHAIQDAVYEMITNSDELKECKVPGSPNSFRREKSVPVTKRIRTYMHGRDYSSKGRLLDFMV